MNKQTGTLKIKMQLGAVYFRAVIYIFRRSIKMNILNSLTTKPPTPSNLSPPIKGFEGMEMSWQKGMPAYADLAIALYWIAVQNDLHPDTACVGSDEQATQRLEELGFYKRWEEPNRLIPWITKKRCELVDLGDAYKMAAKLPGGEQYLNW